MSHNVYVGSSVHALNTGYRDSLCPCQSVQYRPHVHDILTIYSSPSMSKMLAMWIHSVLISNTDYIECYNHVPNTGYMYPLCPYH